MESNKYEYIRDFKLPVGVRFPTGSFYFGMIKFPRIPHLPFSPSPARDDRILSDYSCFEGERIVVTEKMDGENTSIYWNGAVHFRSTNTSTRQTPDVAYIKRLASEIAWKLPEGWRITGELVYYKHSIYYTDIEERFGKFFILFAVWNGDNTLLSWNDIESWARTLDLPIPPVLYKGEFSESKLKEVADNINVNKQEGFVVRVTRAIPYPKSGIFRCVAKWVRPNHVQAQAHWLYKGKLIRNK